MKYGLLKYQEGKRSFNIGDYIQSLAAKQFLPKVDVLINRDKMSHYEGEDTKIILNGWFTHNVKDWIPSNHIIPLFISFHMNNTAAPFMLNDEGIDYLKKHEPIGCRDRYTAQILNEKGIESYFSGCLTLTLDSYKVTDNQRGEDIYIVDPLYGYITKQKVFKSFRSFARSLYNGKIFELGKRKKHLENIISKELSDSAIYINQEPPANTYTEEQKFEMAEELLHKYARAKLVITSRIHCALPCLALGTPVIFINGFDSFVDSCRFDGLINLFNRIDINTKTGEWTSNFGLEDKISADITIKNLDNYLNLANQMKEICRRFIA